MTGISIRMRLTAWYAGVLAVALGASAAASYWAVHQSLHTAVDQGLRDRLEGTRRFIAQQLPLRSLHQLTEEFQDHLMVAMGPGFSLIQICTPSGEVLYQADLFKNAGLPALRPDTLDSAPLFEERRIAGRQLRMTTAAVDVDGRRFGVRLATATDDLELALQKLRGYVLLLGPLIILMSCVGGYWISARALAPVDSMTATVRSITRRNLGQRLDVPATSDELHRLGETLNSMLDRLDTAFQQIGRFTADASHELRSPVALIRTSAEIALRKSRPVDEYQRVLAEIVQEAERMSSVVEDLLTLARADQDVDGMSLAPLELTSLLEGAAAWAKDRTRCCGLEFSIKLPSSAVRVVGNVTALERLLTILTDNACKYTPAPGRVEWSVYVDGRRVLLEVTDTGIGIAREERDRVFQRFYRSDKARSRDSGGAGLGLSIAEWIVRRHHGTILVDSTGERGCRMRVILPMATTAA